MNTIKLLTALLGTGILLGIAGCRNFEWKAPETVVLTGFNTIKGYHCESSAMLNMLRYQGYDLNEAQIIGAGAALGFVLDSSPFPFLGGRNLAMKENFFTSTGIIRHAGMRAEDGDGWEKIYSLLKQGNPVVLRVDMRFLPYLYGGKYGSKNMSFGGHYICLAGFDAEKQTALVTDTEYETLNIIKLADLHKARFSDTKMLPPQGEFYWAEKATEDFSPDWERIAAKSLETVADDMTGVTSEGDELIGLDGLSKFPRMLARYDERIKSYLLAPVLQFHYGSIETNGTGGAAFRTMYLTFLRESAQASANGYLAGAAERLAAAEKRWHELASGMKALSENKAVLKEKTQRKAALAALAQSASELYRSENLFYDYIAEGGQK